MTLIYTKDLENLSSEKLEELKVEYQAEGQRLHTLEEEAYEKIGGVLKQIIIDNLFVEKNAPEFYIKKSYHGYFHIYIKECGEISVTVDKNNNDVSINWFSAGSSGLKHKNNLIYIHFVGLLANDILKQGLVYNGILEYNSAIHQYDKNNENNYYYAIRNIDEILNRRKITSDRLAFMEKIKVGNIIERNNNIRSYNFEIGKICLSRDTRYKIVKVTNCRVTVAPIVDANYNTGGYEMTSTIENLVQSRDNINIENF